MMLCTREDCFTYGLPRGSLSQPARALAGVSVSGDFLELGSHNLHLGTPVTLIADRGRVPRPFVEGTTYLVVPLTEDRFQLSTDDPLPTPPDPPTTVALEDAGVGLIKVLVRTGRQLDTWIAHFSAWVNTHTPANARYVDTEPVPEEVRVCVAVLAGAAMARSMGKTIQTLFDLEAIVRRDWLAMQRGVPLRATEQNAPTNLAVGASPASHVTPRVFE